MKSVIASMHPQWCEKIFHIVNYAPSGEPISEKRFEVRKTRPKIETPFKVYVYETQEKKFKDIGIHWGNGQTFEHHIGKVIGEFICDAIIEWNEDARPPVPLIKTCLSYSQIRRYWGRKEKIFLWHISNPKLYDIPKDISCFYKLGFASAEELEDELCNYCEPTGYGERSTYGTPNGPVMCEGRFCGEAYQKYLDDNFALSRPPQSWYYVEEIS